MVLVVLVVGGYSVSSSLSGSSGCRGCCCCGGGGGGGARRCRGGCCCRRRCSVETMFLFHKKLTNVFLENVNPDNSTGHVFPTRPHHLNVGKIDMIYQRMVWTCVEAKRVFSTFCFRASRLPSVFFFLT